MKFTTRRTAIIHASLVLALFLVVSQYQNCSHVNFSGDAQSASPESESNVNTSADNPPSNTPPTIGDTPTIVPPDVCNGASCNLTPLTSKAAVTTILLALGDEANQQLVINGASARLIAETVVRYSSPKINPKILVVRDREFNGEDPEDTEYAIHTLLASYDTTFLEEPAGGLTPAILQGYDLVWFNNPGYPMSSIKTRNALMEFKGGVILQGDDLTQGVGFSLKELTGLEFVSNGTVVKCDQKSYQIDNNNGGQYEVVLDPTKINGGDDQLLGFVYGNDIDDSRVVGENVEVIATAKGRASDCTSTRPAIVRRIKSF